MDCHVEKAQASGRGIVDFRAALTRLHAGQEILSAGLKEILPSQPPLAPFLAIGVQPSGYFVLGTRFAIGRRLFQLFP